jgi:hypothetical protein
VKPMLLKGQLPKSKIKNCSGGSSGKLGEGKSEVIHKLIKLSKFLFSIQFETKDTRQ